MHSTRFLDVIFDVSRLTDRARRDLSYVVIGTRFPGYIVTPAIATELSRAAFVVATPATPGQRDPDHPECTMHIRAHGLRGRRAVQVALEMAVGAGCQRFDEPDATPIARRDYAIAMVEAM